jgi:hypothetical protein
VVAGLTTADMRPLRIAEKLIGGRDAPALSPTNHLSTIVIINLPLHLAAWLSSCPPSALHLFSPCISISSFLSPRVPASPSPRRQLSEAHRVCISTPCPSRLHVSFQPALYRIALLRLHPQLHA